MKFNPKLEAAIEKIEALKARRSGDAKQDPRYLAAKQMATHARRVVERAKFAAMQARDTVLAAERMLREAECRFEIISEELDLIEPECEHTESQDGECSNCGTDLRGTDHEDDGSPSAA